ncbi:dUTP diphosphatase [Salirhabdus sp. Marseille-P4669]|uniref:dUTP diphosphatase n=1 Tax=Salirhabdus sp. Marseille-P4669 TaxID=2042310 RepID=UPI000C7E3FC6|nr:dUTP diphosphatase [Salirhabdus sp. Marseille-P4669]
MNWDTLFSMQRKLDKRIKEEHQLQARNLVPEKLLALFVELGELANETRCFKFWSNKGPNEQKVILEEYVDGLHFILSIGIELGFTFEHRETIERDRALSLTEHFLRIYEQITMLQKDKKETSFIQLVDLYLLLGSALGFSEEMIEKAYFQKNEVNHVRQDEGY